MPHCAKACKACEAELMHSCIVKDPFTAAMQWCRGLILFVCMCFTAVSTPLKNVHAYVCVCVCRYLHATGHQFGRPIAGQKEISGYASPTQDNLWKAMVGQENSHTHPH